MSYLRTPEHRALQSELIRSCKPWERSTGPTTVDGKAIASRNAYKGGHLVRLRELTRLVNAEIRAARDLLSTVL